MFAGSLVDPFPDFEASNFQISNRSWRREPAPSGQIDHWPEDSKRIASLWPLQVLVSEFFSPNNQRGPRSGWHNNVCPTISVPSLTVD